MRGSKALFLSAYLYDFFCMPVKNRQLRDLYMRIKVHCQNRIGILRDILNLLVEYGINVLRGRWAAIMAMRSIYIARTW